jgi:hypothetical protein
LVSSRRRNGDGILVVPDWIYWDGGTTMNERQLCVKLHERFKELNTPFVWKRHEDGTTAGIPDISVDGLRRTTWWEVKHASPDFSSFGLQELMMLRLATHAWAAFYIIYETRKSGRMDESRFTYIVHPSHFANWRDLFKSKWSGHAHKEVARFIHEAHLNANGT